MWSRELLPMLRQRDSGLRPGRVDVAAAGALGLFAVAEVVFTGSWPSPAWASVVVVAVASLSLMFRRTRPLLALTGALSVLAVSEVVLGHYQSWGSVLIGLVAVYSAAAHGSNPPYTAAVTAGFAGTLGLGEPPGQAAADVAWSLIALSLPFGVGLSVRRARDRELQAQRRAELEEARGESAVAAAAEQERRRIARELHDILSHALGAMIVQAGAAEQALDRDSGRARDAIRAVRDTGLEAVGEMSRFVGVLRADGDPGVPAPQPSLDDIGRLVTTARADGVEVHSQVRGDVRRLGPGIELNAYRVVQEGLTNALKHAGPTPVTIILDYRRDDLVVEVRDAGTGEVRGPGGGFGLSGLRERVTLFGGRLEAGPSPAGGWTLTASFPTRDLQ